MRPDYTPETILGIMAGIYNIAVVWIVVWGIVSLYRESHSWHSLWLLLGLLASKSYTFIRD